MISGLPNGLIFSNGDFIYIQNKTCPEEIYCYRKTRSIKAIGKIYGWEGRWLEITEEELPKSALEFFKSSDR